MLVLASLPWFTGTLVGFFPTMMLWSTPSWTISPAAVEPKVAIHTSAMHLGVTLS